MKLVVGFIFFISLFLNISYAQFVKPRGINKSIRAEGGVGGAGNSSFATGGVGGAGNLANTEVEVGVGGAGNCSSCMHAVHAMAQLHSDEYRLDVALEILDVEFVKQFISNKTFINQLNLSQDQITLVEEVLKEENVHLENLSLFSEDELKNVVGKLMFRADFQIIAGAE